MPGIQTFTKSDSQCIDPTFGFSLPRFSTSFFFMHGAGRTLSLFSLVIGPLWLGSYFGEWRLPLLICATLAICILLVAPKASSDKPRGESDLRQPRRNWWLALLLVSLTLQGFWMWYNAWGEFTARPWHIHFLDEQPSPSLPGATDRAEAWDRLSYIIPCLGIIWVTRSVVVALPNMLRTIAATIFWTGAAVALLGLMQRWTGAEGMFWSDDLIFSGRSLFFGTFRSPGIASCYLNMALAMGLSLVIAPTSQRRGLGAKRPHPTLRLLFSILKLAGVIVVLTAVVSAGSKAGMFFGFLTLLLWASLNKNAIKRAFQQSTGMFSGNRQMERNLMTGIFILICILAGLSFAGTTSMRWEKAHEVDYSTMTERGASNAVQMEMIQDPDWGALGFGPGSFYPLFHYYSKGTDLRGIYAYGHNDYLQTLIEWGWLGTGILTLLIGGGLFLLLREIHFHKEEHRKRDVIYMRGCLIAMTTMLLHATVDFPFQIESIAVTFSVILGMAWAAPALREE